MTATTSSHQKKIWGSFYSEYSGLTKQNRHILKKMYRYIRTFPLKGGEIEQIKKDLIGMATESQERGESFLTALGKEPREFCDHLIFAIGGIHAPGGRRLLRAVACYYQILSFTSLVCLSITLIVDFMLSDILPMLILGFYYISGSHALKYCADMTMSDTALKWGIATLFVGLFEILCSAFLTDFQINSTMVPPLLGYLISGICITVQLGMPILYIIGARRNRPQQDY